MLDTVQVEVKEFIMHSRQGGDLLICLWMQTKWALFCWLEYI